MPITSVSELIKHWSGFEDLVAELHDTGEVQVERNVTLKGKSGADRQIDVLIRHKVGYYDHLIVIECKYLKRSVTRHIVDSVAAAVTDLGASKGVIFTNKGFQKGALAQAKHSGVELFQIRDTAIKVVGHRYGRVVYRCVQCCLLGVTSRYTDDSEHEAKEHWTFDEMPNEDDTGKEKITVKHCDLTGEQLRNLLVNVYYSARGEWWNSINELHVGVIYTRAAGEFKIEHTLFDKPDPVKAHSLVVEAGFKLFQDEVLIDALDNIHFILAVVDCINGTVHGEYRKAGQIRHLGVTETVEDKIKRLKRLRPFLREEELEDIFGFEVFFGMMSAKRFPKVAVGELRYVQSLSDSLSSL